MRRFNFNNLERNVQGVQNGICDSTYAVTNAVNNGFRTTDMAMMQGFNGVDRNFCDLSHQLSDCCCQTQRAIDGVNYNMAKNTCDIVQSSHNDTDRVIAKLNEMEFNREREKNDALRLENQTLKFQASQSAQNGYIDAIGNSIVNRIAPPPQPAYHVPAPFPYCGNGWQGNGGCNSGCGCN